MYPLVELKRISLIKNIAKSNGSSFYKWLYKQIINGKCTKDPVIPYFTNADQGLRLQCNNAINKLNRFICDTQYTIIKKFHNDNVSLILITRTLKKRVTINKMVYTKLITTCTHKNPYMAIWCLVARYKALGMYHTQFKLPQIVSHKFPQTHTELLATPINNTLRNYYGIFYDIEQYFGSKGSFAKFIPTNSTYIFNIPFNKSLIENIHVRIHDLTNINNKAAFILILPVWTANESLNHCEFELLKELEQRNLIEHHELYNDSDITYLNISDMTRKRVKSTHIIITKICIT